jgi:hypothetical protein
MNRVSTGYGEYPNIDPLLITDDITNAYAHPFVNGEDIFRHIHWNTWEDTWINSPIISVTKKRLLMKPPIGTDRVSIDRSRSQLIPQTRNESFARYESTPTARGGRKVHRVVLVGQIDLNACLIEQAPSITLTNTTNITNLYHCNLYTGRLSKVELDRLADSMNWEAV